MNRKGAFTLIELLLVLLLLGAVMTVVLACFDGGFRVYSRVSAFGTGEVDVYLAGEVLERDLRNAIDLVDIPFRGDAGGMEFATVVYGAGGNASPVRVRYRPAEVSAVPRGVMRSVSTLSSASDGGETSEQWLADGYRLVLDYLEAGAGAGAAAGGFVDRWPEGTNLPAAVRMTVAGGSLAEGPVVRTVGVSAPGGGRVP